MTAEAGTDLARLQPMMRGALTCIRTVTGGPNERAPHLHQPQTPSHIPTRGTNLPSRPPVPWDRTGPAISRPTAQGLTGSGAGPTFGTMRSRAHRRYSVLNPQQRCDAFSDGAMRPQHVFKACPKPSSASTSTQRRSNFTARSGNRARRQAAQTAA